MMIGNNARNQRKAKLPAATVILSVFMWALAEDMSRFPVGDKDRPVVGFCLLRVRRCHVGSTSDARRLRSR